MTKYTDHSLADTSTKRVKLCINKAMHKLFNYKYPYCFCGLVRCQMDRPTQRWRIPPPNDVEGISRVQAPNRSRTGLGAHHSILSRPHDRNVRPLCRESQSVRSRLPMGWYRRTKFYYP